MTDRQKPKPTKLKAQNDSRPNRKAFKKGRARGSQKVALSNVEKVLLGQGAYRNIHKILGPAKKQERVSGAV